MKKNKISILIFPIIFLIISLIFFIYAMKISKSDEENNANNKIIAVEENNSGIKDLLDETENTQNDDKTLEIEKDNMVAMLNAVILEVHLNRLPVMSIGNEFLYNVSFGKQGNIGFQKGQEIIIYYDGLATAMYPSFIANVGKIEIIKEQTDIAIPDKYLEYYNKPTNNMSVSLLSLTQNGISFIVNSEVES